MEDNNMESMITSAVFLLKKYVRTKRDQIVEALKEEERALIEPSQSLIGTLREAQTLVDHLEGSVKSLDVSFKMIDKKIRDKLTIATAQQNMLRCRRNKAITVSHCSGNQTIPNNLLVVRKECSPITQLSVTSSPSVLHTPISVREGSVTQAAVTVGDESPADFRCPFCVSRPYTGKPPLLRHIVDVHPERYQVFVYIYKLTPEAVLSSDEIGGSSHCNYCSFRERSKAPLLRHIQENHVDQYDFFVQVARLKNVKIPPNRPISKTQTSSRQQSLPHCSTPSTSPNMPTLPLGNSESAITTNNARKSAQAALPAPTPVQLPPEVTISPATQCRPIQTNHHINSIPERRTDHEYSCLKRSPPPEHLQTQNRIKRTRRFQAEQNKSRYMCSQCGDKFSHKNGLKLHMNFYCGRKNDILSTTTNGMSEPETAANGVDDMTCSSPTPSSSSSVDRAADITFGNASFITTVRDLDVILPDTPQADIVQLMKSHRFRQISLSSSSSSVLRK